MSLRLPLVIWTTIPSHTITSVVTNLDGTEVYTGAADGTICKWVHNHSPTVPQQLIPQTLMIPSSQSSVISLCLVASHNTHLLVSCLVHYQLFSHFSFQCIQTMISIYGTRPRAHYSQLYPISVCLPAFPLPLPSLLDEKPTKLINITLGLVAILGHCNDVVILDPYSCQIHCVSTGHSTCVRSLCLSTKDHTNGFLVFTNYHTLQVFHSSSCYFLYI